MCDEHSPEDVSHAPVGAPEPIEKSNMSEKSEKKSDKPAPGTGHQKHSFLVGEHVYLRTPEEDDAQYAARWKQGPIRPSASATKTWLEDDLKGESDLHLIIVRKSDDRPVGSVVRTTWALSAWLNGYVDPMFGETGQTWLGEAYVMVLQWTVDEQQHAIAHVEDLPADKPIVLKMLLDAGARVSSTFREAVKRPEKFTDLHVVTYLSKDWVTTLGDPFEEVKPRSGTGEPRPVIAPVEVSPEDLPRNAIVVGPRVYLRPLQKNDARVLTEWIRKETEPFWSSGRGLSTQTSLEKWFEGLEKREPRSWVRFAVCLRSTGEFIGSVGVVDIDYINRSAESESEFHNVEYRSQGYGTEAKHLLFDYAFNTLGLHSLQSWVMYGNTRSAAALRKQGYRDVGIQPWLVWKDGSFESFGTYELLAEEWRAMPRMTVTAGSDTRDLAGDSAL